ncbi:MAG: hotdog fold domain-containing protein [Acidaminococcaceae bacterium]
MTQPREYTWCFACGQANPIGLKLKFSVTDTECTTTFVPKREHQSYDGRMHGGLISTLLDEVMGNYLYLSTGKAAYTAKIEVRFRQPILIGEKLTVIGRKKRQKGRLVEMVGQIIKEDGVLAAEAEAKMMYEGEL